MPDLSANRLMGTISWTGRCNNSPMFSYFGWSSRHSAIMYVLSKYQRRCTKHDWSQYALGDPIIHWVAHQVLKLVDTERGIMSSWDLCWGMFPYRDVFWVYAFMHMDLPTYGLISYYMHCWAEPTHTHPRTHTCTQAHTHKTKRTYLCIFKPKKV